MKVTIPTKKSPTLPRPRISTLAGALRAAISSGVSWCTRAAFEEIGRSVGAETRTGKTARAPAVTWRAIIHPEKRVIVHGWKAVKQALRDGVFSIYADKIDNPEFDAEAYKLRRWKLYNEMCARLPGDLRRAAELGAATPTGGWAAWEERTLRGETPNTEDLERFFEREITAEEVYDVAGEVRLGKSPSPDDGLRAEAFYYGGRTLARALSLAFSLVYRRGEEPESWKVGYQRWLYKGKGDRLDFLSYRDIVLVSNMSKLYERVLLRRLKIITRVDELQGMCQAGVDAWHQLALLSDVLKHRELSGKRTWCAAVDITRAFPTTDVYGVTQELRRRGVGGRLLRSVVNHISGLKYAPGIAPGVDAMPVDAGIGLFQGAVLSPLLFSLYVDDLMRRLRAATDSEGRRIGVGFENYKGESLWCGCLLYMDDVFLLCESREHLKLALDVVFQWAHEARYSIALKKTHVMATMPSTLTLEENTALLWTWQPQGATGPSAADKPLRFEIERWIKYLGFIISADVPKILRQHHAARLGSARAVRDKARARAHNLSVLTFGRRLWAWTLFGRSLIGDVAAAPELDEYVLRGIERVQRETLAAQLGDAAVDTPALPDLAALLVVFGLQRMQTRVLLRRLGFAHAISCSCWRLGDRAKLVDFFDCECKHLPGFGKVSVMGATRRAISEGARLSEEGGRDVEDEFGITAHWPDYLAIGKSSWRFFCRRAAAWDESSWRNREVWDAETGAKSATLLRAIRPTREWLSSVVLRANSGHPRAALVALLVGAWWAAPLVRLVTPAVAAARGVDEVAEEASYVDDSDSDGDSDDGDSRDGGGALDGGYHDDDSGFADDGDASLDARPGERGFAHAPSGARASGVPGDGSDSVTWSAAPARCPCCGETSAALDVHVIYGAARGEQPCAGTGGRCVEIPAVRAEYLRRTKELFGRAGLGELLASTEVGTHKHLALLLGGARGLPPALSAELAGAFDETWGYWSHDQRLSGAR